MTTWLARAGWLILILVLTVLVALMVWEPLSARHGIAPTGDREYTAEIVRDEFGVPHIYGKTDADVAYGVAVAHAQDDFSTLQDVAAMTRGRYGAIAGEEGAQIDFAYHLLGARDTAERKFTQLPADTQALFEAYASGMNDYAEANPNEIKIDRLFPINGTDVAAGFALRQPFFFGLNNVIGPLVAGEELRPDPGLPLTDEVADDVTDDRNGEVATAARQTAAASTAKSSPALPIYMSEDGAMAGSNAWAIAPQKSGDGVTRLVSNSHQPWRGGVAWYELVVESEEGWHFAGANFPGSPFPFLGHNEHLGWTNTVNQPDMIDVYELEMNEAGSSYRLDGEWRELESTDVILPVKFGPLVLPVPQTVYRSAHGPVIKNDNGVFAVRYGGIDNIDNLDAYYRLNKATTFDEWQAIIARMDIPSTNFIYGDEAGNIAFVYNAAIPDRQEGPDWRRILPGNDSTLIWDGPVGYDQIPKVVNPASGWVFNANNNPFSAAGTGSDLDPADFNPVLGIETKSTNRARRTVRLMEAEETIDRATLERIKYDTAYDREGYVAVMLDGVAALDLSDEPDLQAGQALLTNWDLDADNVGRGDAIALLMIRPYMGADYQNNPIPDHRKELERSVEHLLTHFGRLDPPMSQVLRLRQGPGPYSVDLPLDGGSDTLRASTLWDVDADGRASVRHGDSFIQFVEWTPGQRVFSESIQPFGSATTRPDSPHYTDQSSLFIQHRLKPVHFWRVDVMENAVRRQTVSNRRDRD